MVVDSTKQRLPLIHRGELNLDLDCQHGPPDRFVSPLQDLELAPLGVQFQYVDLLDLLDRQMLIERDGLDVSLTNDLEQGSALPETFQQCEIRRQER
jgi:hypothetical protein